MDQITRSVIAGGLVKCQLMSAELPQRSTVRPPWPSPRCPVRRWCVEISGLNPVAGDE